MINSIDFLKEATSIKSTLVSHRRRIHKHPELSFKEEKTAEYVASVLREAGISVRQGIGNTGLVAEIGAGDPVVAIRADMDALPIKESNQADYCSQNPGVMHACGHDAHTAIGIGSALLLAQTKDLQGTVRIVFQPAEEDTNSSGKSGASLMLVDGAFDNVDSVLSLHVFPDLRTGEIAVRNGPVLAACDKFEIKIHGQGSHGAYPETSLDPIVMASQVVQAIQTVVSRKNSALEPLVITVGGIKSNTFAPNIISDYVELTGTVRYFYESTQKMVRNELEKALNIATVLGGSFDLNYVVENPPVDNNAEISAIVKSVAEDMIGESRVHAAELQMGGDDFSFLSKKFPSCYFFLGARIEDSPRKLHTETFDIDEDCLPVGAALMAGVAIHLLEARS